ncbi:MAG: DUF523 domain-containing protein [Candidatus Omnitrophota bacterium]|nr:DUF523 domain-containing protein [Candidatus Omnitrophota bacterium]
MRQRILVSSCLIGKKCAYDGRARTIDSVREQCRAAGFVDVCPEIEGGLGCPREAHEIVGGSGEDVLDGKARVLTRDMKDHTKNFIRGAEIVLERANDNRIELAVFKSKSPSCGKGKICAGRFDGMLREGNGVTTALLLKRGIQVFTEKDMDEAKHLFFN